MAEPICRRLVPVRRNPVEAPFEWSNDAISRQRHEPAFPRVKKARDHGLNSTSVRGLQVELP
jgi:hypothetical protein